MYSWHQRNLVAAARAGGGPEGGETGGYMSDLRHIGAEKMWVGEERDIDEEAETAERGIGQ
jgi:hypothetical protein